MRYLEVAKRLLEEKKTIEEKKARRDFPIYAR